MLNRFHWSMIAFGVATFTWWSFFSNVNKETESLDLYPQEHFCEDVGRIYCDIGESALKRGDFSKAIKSYKETLALRPTWLEGYEKLGITYELNNQPEEALKIYAHAMAINPDFLEYRQIQNHLASKKKNTTTLLKFNKGLEWTGQDLTGKKIFVYAEKTLADTILFCRFIPILSSKAAKVYFKPQDELLTLMRSAQCGAILCSSQTNINSLDFDYHISLLSLQHYLEPSISTINQHTAYLHANSEKIAQFKKDFFNTKDLKIGIAWFSSIPKPGSMDQNIPLTFFTPLTLEKNVKIYLLQCDQQALQNSAVGFISLGNEVKNINGLAAAIENLDLVISADLTIATLAGALQKPTWFLTTAKADWRWLHYWQKNKTIWFDHFKKLVKTSNQNWDQPLKMALGKIKKITAKRKTLQHKS